MIDMPYMGVAWGTGFERGDFWFVTFWYQNAIIWQLLANNEGIYLYFLRLRQRAGFAVPSYLQACATNEKGWSLTSYGLSSYSDRKPVKDGKIHAYHETRVKVITGRQSQTRFDSQTSTMCMFNIDSCPDLKWQKPSKKVITLLWRDVLQQRCSEVNEHTSIRGRHHQSMSANAEIRPNKNYGAYNMSNRVQFRARCPWLSSGANVR